jgi:hypothetical protein
MQEIQYELVAADNWRFTVHLLRTSWNFQRRYVLLLVLGPVLGVVATLGSGRSVLPSVLGFTLFVVVFSALVARYRAWQTARSMSGFVGSHRLQLTPEGVVSTSDGIESRIDWARIERIDRGQGLLYFFLGPLQAVLVPLSVFQGDEEAARFAATAESLRTASAASGASDA